MAEIKPVVPSLDRHQRALQQGDNVAWRAQDGIWKDGSGLPIEPVHKPAAGRART